MREVTKAGVVLQGWVRDLTAPQHLTFPRRPTPVRRRKTSSMPTTTVTRQTPPLPLAGQSLLLSILLIWNYVVLYHLLSIRKRLIDYHCTNIEECFDHRPYTKATSTVRRPFFLQLPHYKETNPYKLMRAYTLMRHKTDLAVCDSHSRIV